MANMQKDGISGYVSDYVDSDRIIDSRPENNPFVRVTHFPYDGHHVDHEAIHSGESSPDGGVPTIPFGETYEVTVWTSRHGIEGAYGPMNGAQEACEQAIAIAIEEGGIPIWDTILRLRPRIEIVEDAHMETIPGEYSLAVMDSEIGGMSGVVAVDRETGVAGWGTTTDDALDDLDEKRCWYNEHEHERSGDVAGTDGICGERPHIDGSRIDVLNIVETNERVDTIPELAASFVGVVTLDEAKAALDWAEDNPVRIEELRDQRDTETRGPDGVDE